jgi:HTH-type transcriptional regulator/antitoxin HigA
VTKIQTDHEYEAALAELDSLWDMEPGSPESRMRDKLVDAIEEYEAGRFPVAPPTLTGAIEFHLDRLGLAITELVKLAGFEINPILAGERLPTQAEIQALASILGFDPNFLSEPTALHD